MEKLFMNGKRYGTSAALLRYLAAIFAIIAFAFLFGKILYTERGGIIRFADIYFNKQGYNNVAHVYDFIFQLLIVIAGIFGVCIVFIDPLADNQRMLSLITGGVLVVCGIFVLLIKVMYCGIDRVTEPSNYHLYGTTIAAGILAILAGGCNVLASFVKE